MATFTKRRVGAPAGFFAVEAAGLRWLAAAEGARVAGVIEVSETAITLEQVAAALPSRDAAAAFGEALARTHDAGAASFGTGPDGWAGDGFIGDAPLSLRPDARWGVFFATQRVLPYVRTAAGEGTLSPAARDVVERVCERLVTGDFDDAAPPARIHGDLWSGNVLWSDAGVVLVDPAAHGGHRITDLAMLALFGAPYLQVVLASYENASSQLPQGWRNLIGLHQLHPLLVHAVLFGGGYADRAAAVARPYI